MFALIVFVSSQMQALSLEPVVRFHLKTEKNEYRCGDTVLCTLLYDSTEPVMGALFDLKIDTKRFEIVQAIPGESFADGSVSATYDPETAKFLYLSADMEQHLEENDEIGVLVLKAIGAGTGEMFESLYAEAGELYDGQAIAVSTLLDNITVRVHELSTAVPEDESITTSHSSDVSDSTAQDTVSVSADSVQQDTVPADSAQKVQGPMNEGVQPQYETVYPDGTTKVVAASSQNAQSTESEMMQSKPESAILTESALSSDEPEHTSNIQSVPQSGASVDAPIPLGLLLCVLGVGVVCCIGGIYYKNRKK